MNKALDYPDPDRRKAHERSNDGDLEFMSKKWTNLVVETQFATELVLQGIRYICSLPMDGNRPFPITYSEEYPLNMGLHIYTSGLERLCKLAIACSEFLATGSFANVRQYSHKLSDLFDALESIELNESGDESVLLTRPSDEYGSELIEWLEQYASGKGRYELIDSLSNHEVNVATWEGWKALTSRGTVSSSVSECMVLHHAIYQALTDLSIRESLESSAGPFIESSFRPFSEAATSVGLAMFRRARWPAAILSKETQYTDKGLPILSEVLYVLTSSTDDFFKYEIAQISDSEPVADELTQYFSRHLDLDDGQEPEHFDDEAKEEQ